MRPNRQEVLERQLNYQERYADPNKRPAVTFQRGDLVFARKLLGMGHAFSAAWTGPHEVVERVTDVLYTIDRDGLHVNYHIDKLRPAPPADQVTYDESSEEENDDGDRADGQGPEDDNNSSDEESDHDESIPSSDEDDTTAKQAKAVTGTNRAEPLKLGKLSAHLEEPSTSRSQPKERCPARDLESGRFNSWQPATHDTSNAYERDDPIPSCPADDPGSGRSDARQPAQGTGDPEPTNQDQGGQPSTSARLPLPRRGRRRVRLVIRDTPPTN